MSNLEKRKDAINEFLADNTSVRKVVIDEENNIYINLRGITLFEILTDKEIFNTLYEDIRNTSIASDSVMYNFFRNISSKTYEIIHNCIADEEDQALFTVDVLKELDNETINIILLTIIEMTLPSKKKIQSFKIQMKRIDMKTVHLEDLMTMMKK